MASPSDIRPSEYERITSSSQQDTRDSRHVWNPHQGIVFSRQPQQITQPLRARSASNTGVAGFETFDRPRQDQRAFSTSSLQNLGRSQHATYTTTPSEAPRLGRTQSAPDARIDETSRSGSKFSSQLPPNVAGHLSSWTRYTDRFLYSIKPLWNSLHAIGDYVIAYTTLLHHWVITRISGQVLSFGLARSIASVPLPHIITRNWSQQRHPLQEPRRQYWTYGHDGNSSAPDIRICTDVSSSEEVLAQFMDEEVVGLDLEWQAFGYASSGIKANVSLIQLAKKDLIALLHIARFPGEDATELMPPKLKQLIENPTIMKAGVNIAGDCTRLQKHLGIQAQGVVELSHVYRLVKYSNGKLEDIKKINKMLVSLATQVEEHLGLPLCKDEDLRTSDWSQPLTAAKIMYAASDAAACLQLWHVLDGKRAALDPAPPRPAFYEDKQPLRLASGETVAEYLASQRVDAAAVAEIMQRDSDADSDDLNSVSDISDSEDLNSISDTSDSELDREYEREMARDHTRSTKVPVDDAQSANLLAAARAFAAATHAELPPATCPSPRLLQAYYLWHAEAMAPPAVGRLLGVKATSVACYTLAAVQAARLPCDRTRLERELLPRVPPRARGRFAGFLGRGRSWGEL